MQAYRSALCIFFNTLIFNKDNFLLFLVLFLLSCQDNTSPVTRHHKDNQPVKTQLPALESTSEPSLSTRVYKYQRYSGNTPQGTETVEITNVDDGSNRITNSVFRDDQLVFRQDTLRSAQGRLISLQISSPTDRSQNIYLNRDKDWLHSTTSRLGTTTHFVPETIYSISTDHVGGLLKFPFELTRPGSLRRVWFLNSPSMTPVPGYLRYKGNKTIKVGTQNMLVHYIFFDLGTKGLNVWVSDEGLPLMTWCPSTASGTLYNKLDGLKFPPAELNSATLDNKPVPEYRTELLTIGPNKQKEIIGSGSLSFPEGSGPFPVVLLISGSGIQDRNGNDRWHKWWLFLDLANTLNRRGFAVLRFDDRGFFSNEIHSNFFESLSDAESWLSFLRNHSEINQNKIFLFGHSQGAGIAAMLANNHRENIAGIIMAAPVGYSVQSSAFHQLATYSRFSGVNSTVNSVVHQMTLYKLLESPLPWSPKTFLAPLRYEDYGPMEDTLRAYYAFEPDEVYSALKTPVLLINGTLDTQLPPVHGLQITAILRAQGNPDVTFHLLPNINHMLMPAISGFLGEYDELGVRISDEVMELIAEWLSLKFQKK